MPKFHRAEPAERNSAKATSPSRICPLEPPCKTVTSSNLPVHARSALAPDPDVIRLTYEQWDPIRKHFPEEHILDGVLDASRSRPVACWKRYCGFSTQVR